MGKKVDNGKAGQDTVKNPFKHIVLFPGFVPTPETKARKEKLLESLKNGGRRQNPKNISEEKCLQDDGINILEEESS